MDVIDRSSVLMRYIAKNLFRVTEFPTFPITIWC